MNATRVQRSPEFLPIINRKQLLGEPGSNAPMPIKFWGGASSSSAQQTVYVQVEHWDCDSGFDDHLYLSSSSSPYLAYREGKNALDKRRRSWRLYAGNMERDECLLYLGTVCETYIYYAFLARMTLAREKILVQGNLLNLIQKCTFSFRIYFYFEIFIKFPVFKLLQNIKDIQVWVLLYW